MKRFKYNKIKRTYNKINNKLQFSENYDLSQYIDAKSDNKQNKKFILYSIIIHSGSFFNGHYYTIIKDFYSNRYYKLNDTEILNISKHNVLTDFCGGYFFQKDFDFKYKYEKESNVYMLIYNIFLIFL